METCKVDGCENKIHAKACCDTHYRRFKKYGDPLHIEQERHGMINTSEYSCWNHIKSRCLNKNVPNYRYYGGRGIAVCERWLDSFIAFFEDMGSKPFPKAEIDRKDNDGNYEPGNCRWISRNENIRNRPYTKLTLEKAEEIRKRYETGRISQRTLALMYQVDQKTIYDIIHQKTWRIGA